MAGVAGLRRPGGRAGAVELHGMAARPAARRARRARRTRGAHSYAGGA